MSPVSDSAGDFRNEFSWSVSRSKLFDECKRKYYFNHYGSWLGWDRSSSSRTRRLYRLKQLANRHMWKGTLVHEAVAFLIRRTIANAPVPLEDSRKALVARMRDQFRGSLRGDYEADPKRTLGLVEHEYDEPIADSEWRRLRDEATGCLESFYEHPMAECLAERSLEDLLALEGDLANPRNRWDRLDPDLKTFVNLPLDASTPDQFLIEDVPVWVKLDLAVRRGNGKIEIVDWKTGRNQPDEPFFQLDVYAYYAWSEWGVSEDDIIVTMQNLMTDRAFSRRFSKDRRQRVKQRILRSVGAMRERLADPERNRAVEDDFPRIDRLSWCRRCRFRGVCRPDLA